MKQDFDKLLANYTEDIQELSTDLRELIIEFYPDIFEKVHFGWKVANYSLGEIKVDNFCYIMPKKDNVSLGFPRATELKDEQSKLEGTGKMHRHIKLEAIEDIRSDYIIDLIHQAAILATESNNG
jgi:hypothetical protein